MKQIIFLFAFVLSTAAMSEEGKDTSGYQTMDMKQFDSLTAKQGGNMGKGVKFGVTCKTDDGRDLESTHPEFSTCMMQKKNKMQQ